MKRSLRMTLKFPVWARREEVISFPQMEENERGMILGEKEKIGSFGQMEPPRGDILQARCLGGRSE